MQYSFTTPEAMASHLVQRAADTELRAERALSSRSITARDYDLSQREAATLRSVASMLKDTVFTGSAK